MTAWRKILSLVPAADQLRPFRWPSAESRWLWASRSLPWAFAAICLVFVSASEESPESHTTNYLHRGLRHWDRGRYSLAERDLTTAIERDAENGEGYYLRALLRTKICHMQDALEDFAAAFALNHKAGFSASSVANILMKRGENELALQWFDLALALEPEDDGFHNERGLALAHLGRINEAIAAYTEALRLNPRSAVAFGNRGNALSDLNDYAAATADYDAALRLTDKYWSVYANRGVVKGKIGDCASAIDDYASAIKTRGDKSAHETSALHTYRAKCLEKLGDTEAALVDYRHAVTADLHNHVAAQAIERLQQHAVAESNW